MKQNKKQLAITMVSLGAVLLALRLRLYTVAVDEKNLLLSGHWLGLVIWAVAALALVYGVLCALTGKEEGSLCITGPVAALGDGLFALVLCLCVISMEAPVSLLEKVRNGVGYLAAAGLLFGAYCRATGKNAFFGCYGAVCVFFVLYLVNIYRVWSSNPQLMDYAFHLAACVSLTLLSYQNAALAVGIGSRRVWLVSGLGAVCFGLSAVYGGSMLLYIGGAGWALTNLIGAEPGTRYEEGA